MLKSMVTRAFQYSLLESLSFEQLERFWAQHPLIIDGKKIEGKAKISHITNPKSKVPERFFFKAASEAERFFVENGARFVPFAELLSTFFGGKNSFHVEELGFMARALIFLLKKSTKSPVLYLMKTIPLSTKRLSDSYRHDIIYDGKTGRDHHYVFMAYSRDENDFSNHYDHRMYTMQQLSHCGTVVGAPPFDNMTMLSEIRTPKEIIWKPEKVTTSGKRLLINGTEYGYAITFDQFIGEYPHLGKKRGVLDWYDARVWMVNKDYYCPFRKRIVLCKGSVYGTPYCLTSVVFRPRNPIRKYMAMFEKTVKMVSESKEDRGKQYFIEKNRQFEDFLDHRTVKEIRYHRLLQRITVDDRPIVRKTQAKILAKILTLHQKRGQKEFEYWQFLEDREIFPNIETHNLSRRIERLQATLKKEKPGLAIRRIEKGRFRLEKTMNFRFRTLKER